MTSTQTLPTRRAVAPAPSPSRTDGDRSPRPHGYDPAELAATLRDLAVRAHRAVRALDAADGRPSGAAPAPEALRELAALHPRIVELQRSVAAGPHRDLAGYLASLRRAVESRLA